MQSRKRSILEGFEVCGNVTLEESQDCYVDPTISRDFADVTNSKDTLSSEKAWHQDNWARAGLVAGSLVVVALASLSYLIYRRNKNHKPVAADFDLLQIDLVEMERIISAHAQEEENNQRRDSYGAGRRSLTSRSVHSEKE